MNKEASCLLAKDLNILQTWPAFCKIVVASVFDDICQLSFQEELDITVHQLRFDLMEFEDICVRLE